MQYREPLFRPPAEAASLILQVAYGCPHNSCRFCGMYKGVAYRPRPSDEVLAEIRQAAALYPDSRRVFLADGDVMALPFARLRDYLHEINRSFPRLARVNSYANGSSINRKSDDELKELRVLKLNTLYLGLESGCQDILDAADKRETVEGMVRAVARAQAVAMKCSVMILLVIGGKTRSRRHAEDTAAALNRMQPRLLSALRYIPVPGTDMLAPEEFLSEYEAVAELRSIIAALDLRQTVFRSNHSSNPVPLRGRLPHDKERLLAELDALLASGTLSTTTPGSLPLFL